jgi:hypothetical protein
VVVDVVVEVVEVVEVVAVVESAASTDAEFVVVDVVVLA